MEVLSVFILSVLTLLVFRIFDRQEVEEVRLRQGAAARARLIRRLRAR